jgi:hypothetical protein
MSATIIDLKQPTQRKLGPADTLLVDLAFLRARLATIKAERERLTIENAVTLQTIRDLEKLT